MRILFVLFFIPFTVSAQLKQVAELSWFLPENLEEDISLVGLDNDFSLLINYNTNSYGREKNIALVKLSSNLEIDWENRVEIDKGASPVQYLVHKNTFYYLFKDAPSKAYILYAVNLDSGQWNFQKFKSLTDISIVQVLFFDNYLLLRGFYDEKPIIEMHNLSDGVVKTLAGVFKKKQEVVDVVVNPYRNELYVFKNVGLSCGLEFSIYDHTARNISNFKLGDKEHKLTLGQVVFREDGEPVLAGSFNKYCTPGTSSGFFITSLDNPSQIEYENLSDLESYADVLSVKQYEKRLVRKSKGKKTQVSERVMYSVPYQNMENTIICGEIYIQQRLAQTEAFLGNYNGFQPRLLTEYQFDYKLNYLLLAEIGADFRLRYSYMKNVDAPKFRHLEPQSTLYHIDNKFYSFLSNENNLIYSVLNDKESSFEKFSVLESDVFNFSETKFKILPLNDNSILVYGFTNVRDKFMMTKEMYFIKKLTLSGLR